MTRKLNCPHCQKKVFRLEDVRDPGHARLCSCPSCGGKVGVPFSQVLLFLVVFVGPSIAAFLLVAAAVHFDFLPGSATRQMIPAVKGAVLFAIPAVMFPIAGRVYLSRLKLAPRGTVPEVPRPNRSFRI